jgi:hypothetical protein
LALAAAAAANAESADDKLARMAALYDEVCLKAFPDDEAVAALMVAQDAKELTPQQVRVTMNDDPARGWQFPDGSTVWLEFPPFHACSVRWNTSEIGDLRPYRALAKNYEDAAGGFTPIAPYDADVGDIHIHAVGEQRPLPDRRTESLFIFDQHITDPEKRAAGQTGMVLRFVHQFAPPPSGAE